MTTLLPEIKQQNSGLVKAFYHQIYSHRDESIEENSVTVYLSRFSFVNNSFLFVEAVLFLLPLTLSCLSSYFFIFFLQLMVIWVFCKGFFKAARLNRSLRTILLTMTISAISTSEPVPVEKLTTSTIVVQLTIVIATSASTSASTSTPVPIASLMTIPVNAPSVNLKSRDLLEISFQSHPMLIINFNCVFRRLFLVGSISDTGLEECFN